MKDTIDTLSADEINALPHVPWLSYSREERANVEHIALIHATDARDLLKLGETISVVREWQHGARDVIQVTSKDKPSWGSGWHVLTPYGLTCFESDWDTSG